MQKVTLGHATLALTAMASTAGQGYRWTGSWFPGVSSQEELALQVSALWGPLQVGSRAFRTR